MSLEKSSLVPFKTVPVPNNIEKIEQVRSSKDPKIKPNAYLQDWFKLRNYQVIGALNFVMLNRMLLGDGAGLGKTLQAMTAFALLKSVQPEKNWKLLVVTIKSSKNQWGSEFGRFTKGISVHVVQNSYKPKGSTKTINAMPARLAQYQEHRDTDVLVVGYSALSMEFKYLIESRGENMMVVFDECQEFKNEKSKTWAAAWEVSQAAKRCYGMSATPIKNRLTEFYQIFNIIVPGLFPLVTAFKDFFCIEQLVPLGSGKYKKDVIGYKNLDKFVSLIKPFYLVRLTDEVSDELPKILSKEVFVEMEAAQQRLYRDAVSGKVFTERLKAKYFTELEFLRTSEIDENSSEADIEKFNNKVDNFVDLQKRYDGLSTKEGKKKARTASLMYCQMAANGPRWLDEEGVGAKEEELEDILKNQLPDAKIIVYTSLESGIVYLEEICKKVKRKCVRISGAESDKERTRAQTLFQDKESGYDVIFITKAGSAAVNLQAASAIIFYDSPWSFGDLYQAIGRAQRLGSEHANVLVMHLVAKGSIDEHVIKLLSEKKTLVDNVIGDVAKGALKFEEMDSVLLNGSEDFEDELYKRIFG